MNPKKKIVILGGGFGGLYAYRSLYAGSAAKDIEVTIINRTNYFLFTPLLHEVATGGLAHHQVVESIRQMIYKTNAKLFVAEILSIDPVAKKVHTNAGDIGYDMLIIALGATTNFYNTPGAREHSMVLKDLHDAIAMRSTFIDAFEDASKLSSKEDRARALTFAIIGGGATGVELAAEAAELFWETFTRYYKQLIDRDDITLTLVNQSADILRPFPESLRKSAKKALHEKGVTLLLSAQVAEVKEHELLLTDGRTVPAQTIIWTAGVRPNTPVFSFLGRDTVFPEEVLLDSSLRITTNRYFQVPNYQEIFAIGDVASVPDGSGAIVPMLAQSAVAEGKHLGKNIARLIAGKQMKPFTYRSSGSLASIGRGRAVAKLNGINLSGPIAWFLWRTIYLFKFFSGAKKLKIAADWTVNIFYPRDITKS